MMKTYFKDKKFRLFFLDTEDGIPASRIPTVIEDDDTGSSLVIAARGAPMFESYLSPGWKMKVKFASEKEAKDREFKEIFDYFWRLPELNRATFFEQNSELSDELNYRLMDAAEVPVKRLLVLAENDEKPFDKSSDSPMSCCEMKEGGPELVIDFLLSGFCHHDTGEWVSKDDPSVKYTNDDPFGFGLTDEDKEHYQFIPKYDFSNNYTLNDLIEYEEDYDDDVDAMLRVSGYYYYYSVNLKAINKLRELISIPYRVREKLTPEQIDSLNAEVPSILLGELDYIARTVLMQKVDSYVDDRVSSYQQMRTTQWATDTYHALGGDGVNNVYMSDGLSMTPEGRVVDD